MRFLKTNSIEMSLALLIVLVGNTVCLANENVEALCPGAAAWRASHPPKNELHSDSSKISMPDLRKRLLSMAARDQSVRLGSGSHELNMGDVDGENHQAIKEIVSTGGFPSVDEVGRDGVRAAWLVIQHASVDPELQFKVLQDVEERLSMGEVSGEQFALLYDRVALQFHHQKQKYGTQLYPGAESATPFPIDQSETVDERRASLGMMPLKDYLCLVTALRKQ